MADEGGIKLITDNRKAFHSYMFDERVEAGIVLKGTEVKSLRDGKVNIKDGYAVFKSGELFLLNVHIGAYAQGNIANHEPLRTRKLLLHRSELGKLWTKAEIKGYSLIPIKMYFKKGLAKIEIGLGKGKKSFDKRQATKEKDEKRSLDRVRKGMR